MGALAAFMSALLAVLMVFGAGFTAVMLAVTGNRMFTEFAGTFRTIADTFTVNHGSDSCGWSSGEKKYNPCCSV
jgi:uncharacterized protein YPO0396